MRRLVLTALLALAAGCTSGSVDTPAPMPRDAQLEPVADNPHGDYLPLPDPEAQAGSVGRAARRLTVAQLKESIKTAVGREWTDLEARAQSLGRADFAQVVNENTEPNLVFAKFLDDGARSVCMGQASSELAVADPQQRVLSRTIPGALSAADLRKLTDAQVKELLVYLSTRFWGAPLSGDELARYANFFTQAATRAETIKKRDQALAVVCIAMLTDSRFITY